MNRRQLIESRRAWLSIEWVRLEHPTHFGGDGLTLKAKALVKNHGATPALSVVVKFTTHFPKSSKVKYRDAEADFVAGLRNYPAELGTVLLPGDTLETDLIWGENPEKFSADLRTHPVKGLLQLDVLTLFVGVTYRIVGDDKAHITHVPHAMTNIQIGLAVPNKGYIELGRQPFIAGEVN